MKRLQLISNRISQNGSQHNGKTQPQFTKLSIFYQGAVGYVSLRSPQDLNCLGAVMIKELCDAIKTLHEDTGVNVIVIVSELTNIFCAGADIKWFSKSSFDYEFGMRHQPLHALFDGFQKNKKPIIAAINGKALGGGFQLALLCDIILASQKAYFAFPQINLGLMPGLGGTQRLTQIIGEKKAMRYILTGEGFPAAEAWRMNIAEKVSSQKFNQEVQSLAQKISSKALTTAILAKKAIRQASNMTLGQGLDFEKDVFYSMFNTKAAKQGISAFVHKKKPNFHGL